MPVAPLQPCSGSPTCPNLTAGGLCPKCAGAREKRRPTAHARGYTYRDWRPFRPRFIAMLVEQGLLPVCGEALLTGPTNRTSACRDAGLLTFASQDGSSLHLDHEPELEDWERAIPAKVCDPNRIVLKCRECHSAKTARAGGGDRNVCT